MSLYRSKLRNTYFYSLSLIIVVLMSVAVQINNGVEAFSVKGQQAIARIEIQPSPLIGGPKWFPVHCKVVIDEIHYFDFVPINATNPQTLQRLLTLQPVPAVARFTVNKRNNTSSAPSSSQETDTNDGTITRAIKFCEAYNKDLHLIYNNCWTFAFEILRITLSDDVDDPD
jgi:hypothetical protein